MIPKSNFWGQIALITRYAVLCCALISACRAPMTTPHMASDGDGDGVADSIDLCPNMAGLPEANGCPDGDGDGVPDHEDRCPDIFGAIALSGCPDISEALEPDVFSISEDPIVQRSSEPWSHDIFMSPDSKTEREIIRHVELVISDGDTTISISFDTTYTKIYFPKSFEIDPEEDYWGQIQNGDANQRSSALASYLRKYPDGKYSDEAKEMLDSGSTEEKDVSFDCFDEKYQDVIVAFDTFPTKLPLGIDYEFEIIIDAAKQVARVIREIKDKTGLDLDAQQFNLPKRDTVVGSFKLKQVNAGSRLLVRLSADKSDFDIRPMHIDSVQEIDCELPARWNWIIKPITIGDNKRISFYVFNGTGDNSKILDRGHKYVLVEDTEIDVVPAPSKNDGDDEPYSILKMAGIGLASLGGLLLLLWAWKRRGGSAVQHVPTLLGQLKDENMARWVRKTDANSVNVVFIHGINSSEHCWRHENGTFWPDMLKDEEDYKSLGIYCFNYKTGINSGHYSLADVEDSLKAKSDMDEVMSEKGVIFVCHSMGGIVARKFIVDQQLNLLRDGITKIGLFLIASPSLGSTYANVLSGVSRLVGNTQATALRFSQSNVWLNELDQNFKNLKGGEEFDISGKELVEDLPIFLRRFIFFKKQVVEPFSAAVYFKEPFKVAGSDHFSICRLDGPERDQHRLLMQFIDQFMQDE